MAQIEQDASASLKPTIITITPSTTTPEQGELLSLWDETQSGRNGTTMVEWLASTFYQHKKRLFDAVRASQQSQLFLTR